MANPIVWLLMTVLNLLAFALLVWIIFSWLLAFRILNPHQPLVHRINDALTRLFEPMLRPIRKRLPPMGNIDLSPIVLIIAIKFLQYCLVYYS